MKVVILEGGFETPISEGLHIKAMINIGDPHFRDRRDEFDPLRGHSAFEEPQQ